MRDSALFGKLSARQNWSKLTNELMRDYVRFFLNGQEQIVRGDAAFVTLAEYLRLNCGMPGTKVVCAEGDCGACTVLVGRSGAIRSR